MAEPKPIHPTVKTSASPDQEWLALLARVAELERRIASLEAQAAAREGTGNRGQGTGERPRAKGEAFDLERRFASPLLNYLGLIALLVGLALLIRYWMEAHSLAAILLAGISAGALAALGQWMRRHGAEAFSLTLEGTALGLIYVACYLSYAWGGILLSLAAAAAVMVLAIRRAMQRNSQLVAIFVLLAALLGTLLLRSAASGESLLFGYLAAINAGAVWAGRRKGWIGLRFLALIGSHLVAWFWYWSHPTSQLALTASFPVVTFALFAWFVPAAPLSLAECTLGIMNSAAFLAASASLLRAHYPALLLWSPLALAMVHLCIGVVGLSAKPLRWERGHPGRSDAGGTPALPWRPFARLHFWLSAFLFAAGIGAAAVVLPASWIAMGWTAEAFLLGFLGTRRNHAAIRNAANLLGLAAAVAIQFALRSSDGTELRSVIIAATLAFAGFVVAQHSFCQKYGVQLGNWEWCTHWMLATAAIILPMLALSQQISAQVEKGGFFTPSLATSLVWAVYSMGICLAGWLWVSPFLRWTGVVLLLVTTLKVFLVDPATLSGLTRIVSFLLLALVLLLLSYLFQTRRR